MWLDGEKMTMTVPVVVDAGFGRNLSEKAERELATRKGLTLRKENGQLFIGDTYDKLMRIVPRNDPDLVAVVREMGAEASGDHTKFRVRDVVVTIEVVDEPDDGCNPPYEYVAVYEGLERNGE